MKPLYIKFTITWILIFLIYSISSSLYAQNKTLKVTGTVYDESGITLPSVTITVKGQKGVGVLSDNDGKFTISVPEGATLVFSFVGMKSQEVIVNAKQIPYKVILQEDSKSLEEVVVTGYQTLKKHEVVGSTYTVKGDDVRIAGINRIDAALQGMIPGVSITIPSGLIGSAPQVRVRGTSTVIGNASPVWVIDGIIQEDPLPFAGAQLNDILSSGDLNSAMASISGSSISGLNPDDIESITFLKDASATAIYGVKAANGVIVITTKRGSNTDGRINVNFRTDISMTPRRTYAQTDQMNSADRIALSKEIIESGVPFSKFPQHVGYEGAYLQLINKEISMNEFNQKVTQMEKQNTNWLKLLSRNAVSQNYSLSLSGGNDRLNFYGSVGFNKSLSSYKGNDQSNKTINFSVDAKLRDNLRTKFQFSASQSETDAYYTGVNPEDYALNTSRIIAPNEWYVINESKAYFQMDDGSAIQREIRYNFLNELKHTGNENKNTKFQITGNLIWNITPEIKYELTTAFTRNSSEANIWADDHSYAVSKIRGANYGELVTGENDSWLSLASVLPYGGILNYNNTNQQSYTVRNQLNYGKILDEEGNHALNIALGHEIRGNSYIGQQGTEYGYMPDRGKSVDYDYSQQANKDYILDIYPDINYRETANVPSYRERHSTKLTDQTENYLSYYATLGYTYSTKYTLSFSFRQDASNKFGQNTNNRFNPVLSAGIRWNVSEENFMRRFGWLSNLTLKASYGTQGKAPDISPNLIANFNIAPDILTGEQYLSIKNLPNKDLKWEKTRSFNGGIELSILDNRIYGSIDYYYKKTIDAITYMNIPIENGTPNMAVNNGTIINKGYDISLTVIPVNTKDFRWSINATSGFNRNEIKDNEDNITLGKITDGSVIIDGFALNSFWSFPYIGLSDKGTPNFAIIDQTPGVKTKVETGTLLDYMVYSDVKDPIFSGGLSTSFRYKQLTLSASFNFQLGHHKRLNPFMKSQSNGGRVGQLRIPDPEKNASTQLNKRWRQAGDEKYTDIPAILASDEDLSQYLPDNSLSLSSSGEIYRYQMYNLSDLRVVKADHLRCNSICLAYALPKNQLDKIKLTNLTFALTVTDPFIIKSKKLGKQDPETLSTSATNVIPVVDRQRKFSLSISLGF